MVRGSNKGIIPSINKTITGGISYDIDINDINSGLARDRELQLTPDEELMLLQAGYPKRDWLSQLGLNLKADTKDMLGGLSTIGTVAAQYGLQGLRKLRDNITGTPHEGEYPIWDFINTAVKNKAGDVVEAVTTNPVRAIKSAVIGVTNPLLYNYNTSVSDISNTLWDKEELTSRLLPNALRGAYDHPLSTLLDFAPASKVVPKGAVAKTIHNLPIPQGVKNLVPTPAMDEVNSLIRYNNNLAGVNFGSDVNRLSDLRLQKVANKIDPTQIVKNVRTGIWEGDNSTLAATQKFADLSNSYSKAIQGLGVPLQETEDVIRANYLLEQLDPNRTKGFQTGELQNLIGMYNRGDDISPQLLNRFGLDRQSLSDMLGKADSLRREGKLAHISQLFANNQGDIALDSVEGINPNIVKWLTRQNVGTATNEELGNALFDTYDFIGRRLETATSSGNTIRDIANNLGKKVSTDYVPGNGEVIISPDFVREHLGRKFADPSKPITSAMGSLKSGVPTNKLGDYADDLYAVDSNLFDAVINSQTRTGKNWVNDANSMFKQTMLTTPKYVADNRWGNAILNFLNGVTPSDYITAYGDIRARQLAPKLLQNETSYAGFLGKDFVGNSFLEGEKKALAGLVNKDNSGVERLKNFNLLFANPVIATESALERTDRLANMVRQSKRLAGRDWQSYLKEAGADSEKYRDLIRRVDSELGDYAGRNYYIPPKLRNALDVGYTFYKYPAQSARATWNLAKDKPLNYQLGVNLPQELGSAINQIQQGVYGDDLGSDFKGGLVGENKERSWEPLTIDRFSANPITAPLEVGSAIMGGNPRDVVNISPILGDLDRIVSYKNSYGDTPSSPDYKVSKGRMVARDDLGNITTDMYNPSFEDYLHHTGAVLGNQFVVPVRQANSFVLPTQSYLTGKPYYPAYDTSLMGQVGDDGRIPWFFEGKVERKGKDSFEDLLENLFGLQRYKVYPDRKTITPSEAKTIMKYDLYNLRSK